jgi:hypothetical protein
LLERRQLRVGALETPGEHGFTPLLHVPIENELGGAIEKVQGFLLPSLLVRRPAGVGKTPREVGDHLTSLLAGGVEPEPRHEVLVRGSPVLGVGLGVRHVDERRVIAWLQLECFLVRRDRAGHVLQAQQDVGLDAQESRVVSHLAGALGVLQGSRELPVDDEAVRAIGLAVAEEQAKARVQVRRGRFGGGLHLPVGAAPARLKAALRTSSVAISSRGYPSPPAPPLRARNAERSGPG